MNTSILTAVAGGSIIGAAVFALGTWAGQSSEASTMTTSTLPVERLPVENVAQALPVPRPAFAEIVDVKAVKKTMETPRQLCTDHTVVHRAPVQDEERVAGKLLGAVIGGVVGHQFGGGSGKDAATAGGAVLGGVLGDSIQRQRQQARTYTTTERRCDTRMDRHEKVIGYDVSFRYDGRMDTIRLGYQPESRVPVRDESIVFLAYGGAAITPIMLPIASL